MLTLQPYDLVVSYVPGKYLYLADTLYRVYIEGEPDTSLDEEMSRVVHSLVENTTVSTAKMDEIRETTDTDLTPLQLRNQMLRILHKSHLGTEKCKPGPELFYAGPV